MSEDESMQAVNKPAKNEALEEAGIRTADPASEHEHAQPEIDQAAHSGHELHDAEGELAGEEVEATSADALRFSPELREFAAAQAPTDLSAPQERLYLLLTKMFADYQKTRREQFNLWAFAIVLLLTFGFVYGSLATLYHLTHWLIPSWTDGVLYSGVFFFLLCSSLIKMMFDSEETDLKKNKAGEVERLSLGRINDILDDGAFYATLTILMGLLACQSILLYRVSDHLGFAEISTFREALVISLDNFMHGVFLDVFEMYDIHLSSAKGEKTLWSSTIFLIFRLLYDAFMLLWLYILYQRYRMRKLFKDFPKAGGVSAFTDWMERVCRQDASWLRKFVDELLFFTIAEEYLRGRFAFVRDLSHQFPSIRVDNEVRALFIDPESGEQLFEAQADEEDEGDEDET